MSFMFMYSVTPDDPNMATVDNKAHHKTGMGL